MTVLSALIVSAIAVFFTLSNSVMIFEHLKAGNYDWNYYILSVFLCALPAAVVLPPAIAAARGIKWGVAVIAAIVTVFAFGTPVLLFCVYGLTSALPWLLFVSWGGVTYLRRVIPYLRSGHRNIVFYDYQLSLPEPRHFRTWHDFKVAPPNKRVKAFLWFLLAIPAGIVFWYMTRVILYLLTYLVTGSFDLDEKISSVIEGTLLIGAATVVLFIVRHGLRHIAPSAAVVRHEDRRSPILLLRSFKDENISMYRFGSGFSTFVPPLANWLILRKRLDEFLEESLRSYGPAIAVGRPKEALPSLGAAREYVSDDNWMSLVELRIRQAQLVIAILGGTEGFGWEMSAILRLSAREKLIMVVPPSLRARKMSEQWEKVSKALDVGFELPANAIMLSWVNNTITVLTADQKCRQAAGYRMALAWLLDVRRQHRRLDGTIA